jgi:hypothetical protein
MRREDLPERRYCETQQFWHEGVLYSVTSGFYQDGRVGEIFVEGGKLTSATDVAARDGAIAASIALQFGASIDILQRACLRKPDGSAEGVLGAAVDVVQSTLIREAI